MQFKVNAILLAILCAFVSVGNISPTFAAVLTPEFSLEGLGWTAEEESQNLAKRTFVTTPTASHHFVRINTSEEPHVHPYNDLTVFVLKGAVQMHLGERIFPAKAGDVIDIPRGTMHWASNQSIAASEVYAIFSPPLDT